MTWNSADPLVYVDGMNRQRFDAANPINSTDATGLRSWRYVPGMGTFSAGLGQHNNGPNYQGSAFHVEFIPNRTAFRTTSPACTEIRFIQIHKFTHDWFGFLNMRTKAFGTIGASVTKQNVWHLDAAPKEAPWYPKDGLGENPQVGSQASMTDDPEFTSIGKATFYTHYFEVAAVAKTPGANYGEVYGMISWGHEFWFSGGAVTSIERWINGPPRDDKKFSTAGGSTPGVRSFADVRVSINGAAGRTPSPEMQVELDKAFP